MQSEESIDEGQQKPSDIPQFEATVPSTSLTHLVIFPQWLKNKKLDKQFTKFLEVVNKLYDNVSFVEAILQILNYSKFL